nr:protein get1-like [Quercus suber]
MVSVLLVVFVVQLSLHLLNSVGSQAVSDLLWYIYTKLPTPQSKDAATIASLRGEVVRLNREMRAVSAQDDFAKWARLRREHDKMKDKYDKASTSTQSFRQTFDRIISALRFIGTQGVNFLLNSYFAKQALFWLPQGWVPYQVEWVLSFPRAPLGSVSINIWAIACGSVITMASEAVRASWKLKAEKGVSSASKGAPIKMQGIGAGKKEL